MTDRELLEAAAKAAGLLVRPDSRAVWVIEEDGSPVRRWKPLTDDGEAFRLAVKLELFHIYDMDMPRAFVHFDATEPDQYAATRRAIVCAAAAMAAGIFDA